MLNLNEIEAHRTHIMNIMSAVRGGEDSKDFVAYDAKALIALVRELEAKAMLRVAELEAATRAIPVAEALPPLTLRDDDGQLFSSSDVLAFEGGGWHIVRMYSSGAWFGGSRYIHPSHWRPLPTPPNEVPDAV